MFARETFDYPELEEHPLLCNHLGKTLQLTQVTNHPKCQPFSAPKLKGRPRKRRKLKEVSGDPNSPEKVQKHLVKSICLPNDCF